MKIILLVLNFFFVLSAAAIEPKDKVYSQPSKFAFSKLAGQAKGGVLYRASTSNPKFLNPILADDTSSYEIINLTHMPLMSEDPDTLEPLPAIAISLAVAPDKKTYTYKLNPEAIWSDGSQITADDVVFSFDTMFNSKVDAATKRVYFLGLSYSATDKYTVVFKIVSPKFNTLSSINSFQIISKKQFGNEADFNKAKGIMEPVTSGAYLLKSFVRDQQVVLERRKNWWGYKYPHYSGMYNADTISFKIIPDTNLQYEKFLNKEIDVLKLTAEQMFLKVKGVDNGKFGKVGNAIRNATVEIENKAPKPYTYIGWNNKNQLFASPKLRRALGYFVDYKQIMDKIFHNYYVQTTSPFGAFSSNSDLSLRQTGKIISMDRKKGLLLLKEEGWTDSNGDNILDKVIDGKKIDFKFTLKTNANNSMRTKIAQILKENFKAVGIGVTVNVMEWNSLLDDIDSRNFDALIMGWTILTRPDPKQLWHSDSEKNKGSNAVGYKNIEVDKLIERANTEFDNDKRTKIMQEINRIIYEEQPYTFLATERQFLMGITPKVSAKVWGFDYSPAALLTTEYYQYSN